MASNLSPLPSVAYLGPRTSYSHQVNRAKLAPIIISNSNGRQQLSVSTQPRTPSSRRRQSKVFSTPNTQHSLTALIHSQLTRSSLLLWSGRCSDIFVAVESNTVTYGVVPFENSTNGSVVLTLDLFCDRNLHFPRILVCGEAYLGVHHCLLSSAPSVAAITRLYSHPQAFGQCEMYLNAHLKGVERVDVSSTSKAAQIAAGDPCSAAIASKIAADVPGLSILASNIEDSHDNTTRFFVLSATERTPVGPSGEKDKTLLSFTVDHELPGALCDGLRVFKEFKLNLTSIMSRPSRVVKWNYIFFVEFEGHSDTENVRAALRELGTYCSGFRVLGSYRDKQSRKGLRYNE